MLLRELVFAYLLAMGTIERVNNSSGAHGYGYGDSNSNQEVFLIHNLTIPDDMPWGLLIVITLVFYELRR